jgi:hypothetical protein
MMLQSSTVLPARYIFSMFVNSNLEMPTPPSPLAPLLDHIRTCVLYIAPERETDTEELFRGSSVHCRIDANDGKAVFSVDSEKSDTCEIKMPLAQLERLWALTFGFIVALKIAKDHWPKAEVTVEEEPGLTEPLALISWAWEGLSRGERLEWQEGLPRPDVANDDPDLLQTVNGFFLGALGFIMLHEIGHYVLKHPPPKYQSNNESIRCEIQADDWAANWIFEKYPNDGQFRGHCCVLALA